MECFLIEESTVDMHNNLTAGWSLIMHNNSQIMEERLAAKAQAMSEQQRQALSVSHGQVSPHETGRQRLCQSEGFVETPPAEWLRWICSTVEVWWALALAANLRGRRC